MALAVAPSRRTTRRLVGRAEPRIAPPVPLRSDVAEFKRTALALGLTLIPWQVTVGRYIEAKTAKGTHLYREICTEVSRQNGKTTIAKPVIVKALRAGLRVLHIADKRELPREMHNMIAGALSEEPELFPKRRGKTIWPRYGAGQEEITLANGGRYRIATSRGGRGWSCDVLIIDELREMEDFAVISSASSTLATSPDPLTLYFTNAGDDKSVVLDSIHDRAGADPNLAYLSWSAEADLLPDDRKGWLQANPSIGHIPSLLSWLEAEYLKHSLAGTMNIFETENLCRSVPSMMPLVVTDAEWEGARGLMPDAVRPSMAVKVDPEGRRASAVIAWLTADDRVATRAFAEDTNAPLDVDAFATALKPLVRKLGVTEIGFDPWTDRDLARHFPNARAINGMEYVAAGERFERAVKGHKLVHDDDGTIGNDLAYTVRRETTNGWLATRAGAERATTAGEAAIRAVWLASKPSPPVPRVY